MALLSSLHMNLGLSLLPFFLKSLSQKLNIFDAIADYAPGIENDVENYRKLLLQITKIRLETKLSSLTDEQLILVSEAIKQVEGFQIGIINEEIPRKKILDVKKNKENLIIQYLIEGYGWLHKDKAISLVQEDVIDAVVVKNHKGYIFLRSRPDKSKGNNLDP